MAETLGPVHRLPNLPSLIKEVAGQEGHIERGNRQELRVYSLAKELVLASDGLCRSLRSDSMCGQCPTDRKMCDVVADMIPDDEAYYEYEIMRFNGNSEQDTVATVQPRKDNVHFPA